MTSALFPLACQVFAGGRVLSLDSAQVSDTGRYTCVAVNAGGEQHRDYDLKVYGENMNSCCCIHVPIYCLLPYGSSPTINLNWISRR